MGETEKKIKKTNKRVDAYADALKKEASDVKKLMSAQMKLLEGKVAAQKKAASADIAAANAESAAGYSAAMTRLESELKAAEEHSTQRFGKVYEDMADQRKELDSELAASVNTLNDEIAKQAALADSRFSKTVKDISAARIEGLMNHRSSTSQKARGKLRKILDENKRAAAEEVKALSGLFKKKIAKIRHQAAEDSLAAKKDLTKATEAMYEKLARNQQELLMENKKAEENIEHFAQTQNAAIAASKENFEDRLATLTNVVGANHKKVERGLEVLTGTVRDYAAAGKKERRLIRKQNDAMAADMQKSITRAIQVGEAKAKAVAQRARERLAAEKKAMLVEITNTVEEYADMTFKTIQGSHQKIADNYLSLKAYAVTASDKTKAYIAKGKGKNLSSLGDILSTVSGLSSVKVKKAEGVGAGASSVPAIFSSRKVKVANSVNKINGLVNEYTSVINGVRARWPMGLGKYLLMKFQESMLGKGVLQVDKVSNHAGNWVFINGRAVGLSNKLNDFETLACRMGHYEATLAKLTAALAGKKKKPAGKKPYRVSPPEWPGN